jgi:hypothetical protein
MHPHTRQLSLVGDKRLELGERPGVEYCALRLPSPNPRANVGQILDRNRALRALSLRNNPFGDHMVLCLANRASGGFDESAALTRSWQQAYRSAGVRSVQYAPLHRQTYQWLKTRYHSILGMQTAAWTIQLKATTLWQSARFRLPTNDAAHRRAQRRAGANAGSAPSVALTRSSICIGGLVSYNFAPPPQR